MESGIPKVSKTTGLQYLCDNPRKTWRMKFIFCLLINVTSKVFSEWCYHFRCMWPGMSKLPKITSFLFLSNTLRKMWVMKLILCMLGTNWYDDFDGNGQWPDVSKVLKILHCFIVTQNIMIFHWCPVMLVVTCFWVVGVKNWCSLLDHGFLKSAIYISRMNRWNELIFFMLIQM